MRGRIERTAQRRHHIGAGAPVLADRELHLRGALLDVDGLRRQQAIAEHVDGQLAGAADVDRHGHGVARSVLRLVDRGLQQVRRVGAAVGIPADVELHRGHRAVSVIRLHIQPVAARLRRQRNPRRLVGGNGDVTVRDARRRLDRLVFPIIALAIPLVARLHLQELVAQAVAAKPLALGRDEHDFELGLVALRDVLLAKQRLDADHGGHGCDRQHDLTLDGAAAGLDHADEDLRFLGTRRGRLLAQRDREGCNAVGVGLGQVLQRRALVRGGLFVGDAELVAGKARTFGRGRDQHVAFERQTRGRRAIEEMTVRLKLHWSVSFDQLVLGRQVEFDSVGNVVLDHEGGLADRGALRVGEGAHPPGPGRHGRVERHGQRAAAGALVGQHSAAEFDAIRALDHQGHRPAGDRIALPVAEQSGEIDGLAGAVDAALGIDEGVGARRHRAARNAAVGQVECGGLQAEEGIVGLLARDRQHRRRQAALAARKPGLEQHMAAVVGLARRQNLVVARDQPHLGFADRVGGRQRIHEHVDAVIAGIGCDAEVGNDEPLGCELVVVVRARPLGRGRHHVDAGLEFAERLIDRERGGDVLVQRHRDRELAGPDFDAALTAEVAELILGQRLLEVAVHHRVDQIAVADPEHVDIDRGRVDADHGNAALAGPRQHIGAAVEAHERFAVAHIDVELGRFRQALLHGGRQAGAQIDVAAFAVLQPVDAELLALGRQCRLVLARQREVRRKIGSLRQFLRELEAGARARRVRVHGVVEQPKTVLVAHLLILAADVGDLAHVERQPQRIQRRPP
ncbi:hypothetical protein ACVWZZ_008411 [Bradyrhizobium sp. LM6.10]